MNVVASLAVFAHSTLGRLGLETLGRLWATLSRCWSDTRGAGRHWTSSGRHSPVFGSDTQRSLARQGEPRWGERRGSTRQGRRLGVA
ncbi:hypothetical protein Nepgr_033973 [Nepenthes gracilis]|uniref:Uncharacterized protein n=1 Tax=Nepenthes gracilis TaxID=150966 RepID=A0AAD3Y919_NEPGR|nr:hypothetical protein Nepgr_033973 [Nepenthes gracilis]